MSTKPVLSPDRDTNIESVTDILEKRRTRKRKPPIDFVPETGFVRLPTILLHIPWGASTWWAKVKRGEIEPPIKIGPGTSVWRAEYIRALIAKLANGA